MKHGGHADLSAKMVRVASDRQQSLGGGLKEDSVDEGLVAQGERIEIVGQREDDVEVRRRQQALEPLREPLRSSGALALGAMPVAAGVIRDALVAAAVACVHVPAQCGGAARGDVSQDALLGARRGMCEPVLFSVRTHHVGDLEARSLALHDGASAEDAGRGRAEQIERASRVPDVLRAHVRVNAGGA